MKKLILTISFLVTTGVLFAQTPSELYRMSQQNGAYSTARVAGMGGAYTSLGADIGSISINPAGIGMYSGYGAISITPSLNISSATGNSVGEGGVFAPMRKNNNVTGELSNIGVVYNQLLDGKLKNIAFGFSYGSSNNNKYEAVVNGTKSGSSIADMFSAQLFGINPTAIKDNYPYDAPASMFGAIGAYQSGTIFKVFDDPYRYAPSYEDDKGNLIGSLIDGDMVAPQLVRYVSNRTDDYNFAISFNVNDVLFIGTTLGYSQYNFKQFDDYHEYASKENRGDLDNMMYNQSLYQNGSAFNFIFGVTVQPIKGLRIGASVQAPKIYNMDEEYSTSVSSQFYVGNSIETYESYSPVVFNNYKIKTPTRLNAGISYAFGKVALLSVDYERVWYDKMNIKNYGKNEHVDPFSALVQSQYKASNNIKAGAEVNIPGGVVVRAGYAYYGNASKVDLEKYGTVKNISAGLGYRVGGFSVDLTYVNIQSRTAPFKMYDYYSDPYDMTFASSSVSDIKFSNHNVLLTLGWRL